MSKDKFSIQDKLTYLATMASIDGPTMDSEILRQARAHIDEEERQMTKAITERDYWEEKATELANDVGALLGFDVGEHSNMNCPVQTAIDGVFEMSATVKEALSR